MRKLPKQHKFPGGFHVEIVLAPRGVAPLEDEDEKATYGTLDAEHGRITLWEGLTPTQQWKALGHELVHAALDADNWIQENINALR